MTRTVPALVAFCLLPALRLAAQETPPVEAAPAKATPVAETSRIRRDRLVPLRVLLTIARFEGEKRTSSLPYTLLVNAGQQGRTRLRMGIEVPVRVGPSPDNDTRSGSYSFKNVGTSIDCHADALDDGRFNLDVTTEQSSVGTTADKLPAVAAGVPFFRTFTTSFNALLRDGQTATHVAATDPVSGESVRIEVGIAVVR